MNGQKKDTLVAYVFAALFLLIPIICVIYLQITHVPTIDQIEVVGGPMP